MICERMTFAAETHASEKNIRHKKTTYPFQSSSMYANQTWTPYVIMLAHIAA